jgi:hypothetical protein
MQIQTSVDIEYEVQKILDAYMTAYCRPLPADFEMPCILVTKVGGSDVDTIDSAEIVLDSRASRESQAVELLNKAIGVLRKISRESTTPVRHIRVTSSGSWGVDPVRPDLAMCSARLSVTAHLENTTI